MFYIFDVNDKCIGSCNVEPCLEDLASRGEHAMEYAGECRVGWLLDDNDIPVAPIIPPLTPEQQAAVLEAGKKAEAYFDAEVRKGDQLMIDTYKKAGVEVVEMSKADYDAWLAVAQESAYKNFAAKVPNGGALIEKALAVE